MNIPLIEREMEDDPFYLANKTFYTTCYKISRQNNPNFKKKPPYTFLENWLIHSLFSKSQQILLRFPIVQAKVMITDGDFIYTPHQMVDNNYYEEDEDDTFMIDDEGIIIMSAPDITQHYEEEEEQQVMMDENTWMGHSKYNSNSLHLHVVNPDLDDEDDDDNNKQRLKKKKSFYNQLQMVKEEEEEEDEEEHKLNGLSMSPEIINWYRSADTKSMKSIINTTVQEESSSHHSDDLEKKLSRHSNGSYQSLADMMHTEEQEPSENHPIYSQQTTHIMKCIDATWIAVDIAQTYHQGSDNTVSDLVGCVLKIWKVFILGAGSMLDWKNRIKLQTAI
jgi:hypothetical protein